MAHRVIKNVLMQVNALSEVVMSVGSKLLHVGYQAHAGICLWSIQNMEIRGTEIRKFYAMGTGYELPNKKLNYVGTTQTTVGEVYHVFEEIN